MAFTPFTEEEQPTMANFNAKFAAAIADAKSQALAADVKVAAGSYVGTGTSSGGQTQRISLSFVPKAVYVCPAAVGDTYVVPHGLAVSGSSLHFQNVGYGNQLYISGAGFYVALVNANGSWGGLNWSGNTYNYLAIG